MCACVLPLMIMKVVLSARTLRSRTTPYNCIHYFEPQARVARTPRARAQAMRTRRSRSVEQQYKKVGAEATQQDSRTRHG